MSLAAIKLRDEDIEEFTRVCHKYHGLSLSRKEASAKLHRLVRSVELIYTPVLQDELAEYEYENQHERPHQRQA